MSKNNDTPNHYEHWMSMCELCQIQQNDTWGPVHVRTAANWIETVNFERIHHTHQPCRKQLVPRITPTWALTRGYPPNCGFICDTPPSPSMLRSLRFCWFAFLLLCMFEFFAPAKHLGLSLSPSASYRPALMAYPFLALPRLPGFWTLDSTHALRCRA